MFTFYINKRGRTLLDLISMSKLYVFCLNFIIENNIERIAHRKQGIKTIWNVLPGSDKTSRITPQSFIDIFRGEYFKCYLVILNQMCFGVISANVGYRNDIWTLRTNIT